MDIILNNISYTYNRNTPFEKQVLKNISLEIKQNRWISIIGRTGSGKSTLVQHMNGMNTPSAGTVQIGDTVITATRKKVQPLYDKVGIVFQYPEHQLFEESVLKDIGFGPKNLGWPEHLIEQRVIKAMQQVGLAAELAERSPFQLSGGQKRRVAIAGVLVMNPHIMILDEPTAGLDPAGKKRILQILQEWRKATNGTVITITHQMEDVAEYAEEVIVLEDGEVKWHTDPYTLFTQHATELEELGLEQPQILQLVRELNDWRTEQGLEPICPTSLHRAEVIQHIAHTLQYRQPIQAEKSVQSKKAIRFAPQVHDGDHDELA